MSRDSEIDVARARAMLDNLTPKQVEVLDRIVVHRTTKEIARELEIAPNTVDQRIGGVREKWGTANRKDTARLYTQLLAACGKPTCGISRVDAGPDPAQEDCQDLSVDPHFVLSDASTLDRFDDWHESTARRPIGLEVLDRRFGRTGRVLAIFVLALIMAMTLASSLSIADSLGRLI